MNFIGKIALAAAITLPALFSMQSAQAWGGPGGGYGGGPWNGMTDMFGDVDIGFSAKGWGRGNGYGHPSYGYGAPGYGGYPGMGGHPGMGGYPGMYGAPAPMQAPYPIPR